MKALKEEEFHPYPLFMNYYVEGMTYPKYTSLGKRNVYDYEIELITNCDGGFMYIDDKKYNIKKGDIIFRRPGQTTEAIMRYSCYIMCFEIKKYNRNIIKEYSLVEDGYEYQQLVSHTLIDNIPTQFHTYYYQKYLDLFINIYNCYIEPHTGSQSYISALTIELFYYLNQELSRMQDHIHPKSYLIKEVINYIENNLKEDLNLSFLAKICHITPNYFHQLFKEIVGKTPAEYIMKKRMNLAKKMLVHTNKKIKAIANEVGFKDNSYFGYAFKRETGFTPQEYRKSYQRSIN